MANQFLTRQFTEQFKNRGVFSLKDLFDFYLSNEPGIEESALGWRVFDLKKHGVIESVKKGVYRLGSKQVFNAIPEKPIPSIIKIIRSTGADPSYNIWSTTLLNEFMELQATKAMIILEVDKSSVDGIFYLLKDKGLDNVFIRPDELTMEKYVSELETSIIVRPMITRAPTTTVNNITVPTLEKILIDLYCDEKLFYAYQGNQLVKIYDGAITKYSINFSKLFNYAKRRKRADALKQFLAKNLPHHIKDLI